MKASSITQLCFWLQCTECDLFRAAYHFKYGTSVDVTDDIVAFAEYDTQPPYFREYMRHFVSKLVLR